MKKIALLGFSLSLILSANAMAVTSGEMVAQSCGACHGTQGKLANEAFPALAGMPKAQFVQSMVDFKSGKRVSTIMIKVAEGLTTEEFDAMGDYFAAQKLD